MPSFKKNGTPFLSQSNLVPQRGNQPNLTYMLNLHPMDFKSIDFWLRCYSSKFLKLFFLFIRVNWLCFEFNPLNGFISKFLGGVTSYQNCSVLWFICVSRFSQAHSGRDGKQQLVKYSKSLIPRLLLMTIRLLPLIKFCACLHVYICR